jgi:hypothetical protein
MLSQKKTAQEKAMKIHCTKQFLRAAALLAAIIYSGNILAQSSPSCSVTWTGNAGNGSWSTASNWSTHRVPGPTSDVCIPTLTTADGAGLLGSTPSISVHSIQVAEGGSLLFGSGKVSIATSLTNQGFITLYGTTLSAGSIDLPAPGEIDSYDNSSITSPAFSNAAGTVSVGTGGTLRLADNPVQLQSGTLSGGNWLVAGALIVPSDISQITTQGTVAWGTVVSIDGTGSAVQDASGHNALATLTSVGSTAVLALFDGASLTLPQGLTSQGVVDVGGSLTVSGTYTQASGAATNMGGSLSATSVIVQPGSTLGGNGTVESSITDNGTVAPHGILTVTGNYTQTGGGALTEQFGSTLQVNLNATLSGALNVTVNPKHPPKSGATYTALTFGSLSGSFTSLTAGYTLTTSANSIVVRKQ